MNRLPKRFRKAITLRDVAKHAGVSPKTVSNFINNWPYMTDETRLKVQNSIDELGYRPSGLATSLRTGRTNSIGVIIQDITSPFFGQVIRGCGDLLYEYGYNFILCVANEDLEKEKKHLEMLVSRGVDGLLMFGCRSSSEVVASIVGDAIPIVAENSYALLDNMTILQIDNVNGAMTAINHLIGLGHRRIGYLDGPSQRIATEGRLQGYRTTLEAAGIPYNPSLVRHSAPSIHGGYRSALQLLPEQRPTALFCYNDLIALGAYIACLELKLDIPQDIAIVGFDDMAVASLVEPMLTTMRIHQYELGRMAGESLIERLQNGNIPQKKVLIPVDLVIRNSCGARNLSRSQKIEMLEHLLQSDLVEMEPQNNHETEPNLETIGKDKS